MLSLEDVVDTLRSAASDLRTLNKYDDATNVDVIADRLEEELDDDE